MSPNLPSLGVVRISGLTTKAEPPPVRGGNRDSGTDRANGGWLRRLVRRFVCRAAAGKCQKDYDNAKYDAIDDRCFHAHSPLIKEPARHATKMNENECKNGN